MKYFKLIPKQIKEIQDLLEVAEAQGAVGLPGAIFMQIGRRSDGAVIAEGDFLESETATKVKEILKKYYDL